MKSLFGFDVRNPLGQCPQQFDTVSWSFPDRLFTTGPPTHSLGRQTSNGRGCLSSSSSSVTLHGGPAGGFTRAGQAMTSCRLQSNYSSTVTLHGGPEVLHPVRATPCFLISIVKSVLTQSCSQSIEQARQSNECR